MKYPLYSICVLFPLLLMRYGNCGQDRTSMKGDKIIDSTFQSLFLVIDDGLKDSSINKMSDKKFNSAVDFLEEISGIPSRRDGTFIGWIYTFLIEDFEKWKIWYNNNKEKLKWDNNKKKIYLQ